MAFQTASADQIHPAVASGIAEAGIDATVVRCDPALADTAQFCEAYGFAPDDSANAIMVVGKGKDPAPLAVCLVLATMRLDVNGSVRRLLGTKKASFAPQELACEVTGMEYGGITVIGLPADLPVWIDETVTQRQQIIIGGGNRSTKVLLSPSQLLKVSSVEVVPGLAMSPPSPGQPT
jgi:prolyl-tRNA editing enzyme YbaK/EbsC (Cys-tRNA(Pro) deacylase)